MKRDQKKGSNGDKPKRPKIDWQELVILKGEEKGGGRRACVKITHAEIRGDVCHSFCFGLEDAGGFRPLMHIPEIWVRENIRLMREADALSTTLHLFGRDSDSEFAKSVVHQVRSYSSMINKEDPVSINADHQRKVKSDRKEAENKSFATFADALKAKGQDLSTIQ